MSLEKVYGRNNSGSQIRCRVVVCLPISFINDTVCVDAKFKLKHLVLDSQICHDQCDRVCRFVSISKRILKVCVGSKRLDGLVFHGLQNPGSDMTDGKSCPVFGILVLNLSDVHYLMPKILILISKFFNFNAKLCTFLANLCIIVFEPIEPLQAKLHDGVT